MARTAGGLAKGFEQREVQGSTKALRCARARAEGKRLAESSKCQGGFSSAWHGAERWMTTSSVI